MVKFEVKVNMHNNTAEVQGYTISGLSPTELYVNVVSKILELYPRLIGQKETHFTADSTRAAQYTGTTRERIINGRTVYIKTGFSTKDKLKGIEKLCELAGMDFIDEDKSIFEDFPEQNADIEADTNKTASVDIVDDIPKLQPSNPLSEFMSVAEDYIEILELSLEDVVYFGDRAYEYFCSLSETKQEILCKKSRVISSFTEIFERYWNLGSKWKLTRATDWIFSDLERLAEMGYVSAMLYLSRWYGSGFIGEKLQYTEEGFDGYKNNLTRFTTYSDETSLYIVKSNIKKMRYFRVMAIRNGSAQAAFEKFCYEANADTLEIAYQRGSKNAEILKKYMEMPKHQSVAHFFWSGRTARRKDNYIQSPDRCSLYYCNGYYYYIRLNDIHYHAPEEYVLCKAKGNDEQIIYRFSKGDFHADGSCELFPLGWYSSFCIYNERIYFLQYVEYEKKLCSLDLDGNDLRVFDTPSISSKLKDVTEGIKVTDGGFIFKQRTEHNEDIKYPIFYYEFNTGICHKIVGSGNIICANDHEVYVTKKRNYFDEDYKENISDYLVYDYKENTCQKLSQVYSIPKNYKNYHLIHIDEVREILYLVEDHTKLSKCEIYGFNKQGELVDKWEKPRLFSKFYDGRDVVNFDGVHRVISALGCDKGYGFAANKLLNLSKNVSGGEYIIGNLVLLCDRSGNVVPVFNGGDGDTRYLMLASMDVLTENAYCRQFGIANVGNMRLGAVPLYRSDLQEEVPTTCDLLTDFGFSAK